jgi:hypothetical protein
MLETARAMDVKTRTASDRSPRRTTSARRRRGWTVGGTALLVLAVTYWFLLGPQTVSWLSHRKGAPTVTWALQPFPREPGLRMAVVGDVGEGEDAEWRTGWAMKTVGGTDRYDAVLFLGDNVYPSGDPTRLPETILHPFDPVLSRGAELLAIVGNHDAGHADEQMEILGMPGTWWSTHLPGDVLLIGLDSNRLDDPRQRAFLEEELAGATERWRIVAIHEPPFSAGYQGSNLEVRDAYVPLIEEYGVQLVLSGHDHDYQRSEPIGGVTYVVSGGGGRTRGTGEEDFTAASWSVLHFVDVNVWPDRMIVRGVTQEARAFDEVVIPAS